MLLTRILTLFVVVAALCPFVSPQTLEEDMRAYEPPPTHKWDWMLEDDVDGNSFAKFKADERAARLKYDRDKLARNQNLGIQETNRLKRQIVQDEELTILLDSEPEIFISYVPHKENDDSPTIVGPVRLWGQEKEDAVARETAVEYDNALVVVSEPYHKVDGYSGPISNGAINPAILYDIARGISTAVSGPNDKGTIDAPVTEPSVILNTPTAHTPEFGEPTQETQPSFTEAVEAADEESEYILTAEEIAEERRKLALHVADDRRRAMRAALHAEASSQSSDNTNREYMQNANRVVHHSSDLGYNQVCYGCEIYFYAIRVIFACLVLDRVYRFVVWLVRPSTYRRSRYVDYFKKVPRLRPEVMRGAFNDAILPDFKPKVDHTHGTDAAARSAVSAFIVRLATMTGIDAYFIQCSRADERHGRQGSREYYWAKDITTAPSPMQIPARPLIAMVDVDQYLDMPAFLCDNVHPTIIYTVQPDQVSKIGPNYSYTFDEGNNLKYNVTGGAVFSHKVWNYGIDHFVVSRSWYGIPYRAASYLVDRKAAASDHQIVMLTPVGSWSFLGALFFMWWISGGQLLRLTVNVGQGFARLLSSSAAGVLISTGRLNGYASATIPVAIDDTIAGVSRTSQYVLTLPQVQSYLPEGDRVSGIPLLEYHRLKFQTKPDVVCPVQHSVRRYQFDPVSYDEKAKPSLVGFMSPLISGAFAPDKTVANEVQSIHGRVTNVKPKELALTPFLIQAMDEFCGQLIPDVDKHSLHPTDDDEVLNRQNRPTQRRTFANVHGMIPRRFIKMFQKSEAYANVKDPRAISIVDPVDKRAYSRYMYAFERVLKTQPWYAFSKTPRDVSARVAQILMEADTASNTDFNRFDGHGSNLMRDLEKQLLLRAFHPRHHAELLDLHRGQHQLRAYATFGSKYETDFSRASGSPETSIFNTLVNAFVAFLARRMSKRDGLYIGPVEAFQRLGIYGGDDGLTADIESRKYIAAAKMIGQELTIEPVKRGCPGIKFLARIYSPLVWFGDETSICDVARQVVKFHTSVRLNTNVTHKMKLLEKVRGFILSDPNTPIIGDFCKAVMRIHGTPIEANLATAPMRSWLSSYPEHQQYPNVRAEWMIDHVLTALPEFEYKRFSTWCDGLTTLDQCLAAPMFMAPIPAKSVVPVVVDGEIIPRDGKIVPAPKLPVLPSKRAWGAFKDKKISVDAPVSKDGLKPINLGDSSVKQSFEELKQYKISKGTWEDRPRGDFDAFKRKKIAEGKWVDQLPKTKDESIDLGGIAPGSWRKTKPANHVSFKLPTTLPPTPQDLLDKPGLPRVWLKKNNKH